MNFQSSDFLFSLLESINHIISYPEKDSKEIYSNFQHLDRNAYRMIIEFSEGIRKRHNTLKYVMEKTIRSIKDQKIKFDNLKPILVLLTYSSLYYPDFEYFRRFKQKPLLNYKKKDLNFLFSYYNKLASFSFDIALKGKEIAEKLSIQESIPSFFIRKLLYYLSIEQITTEIEAMNSKKISDYEYLRINTHTAAQSIEFDKFHMLRLIILDKLKKEGINFDEVELIKEEIPIIIKVHKSEKPIILKSHPYNSKLIIYQEKASIITVIALDPKPYELILDMCAAPGMKSSLIDEITMHKSQIISSDFSHSRLQSIFKTCSTIINTNPICQDSSQDAFRENLKFDRILIDAPCTGSGTFSSNPQAKILQNQGFLERNCFIQSLLLNAVRHLTNDNTEIVYSVCSMYAEEGEMQIDQINEDIERIDLPKIIGAPYDNLHQKKGTGRLFPSIHETEGFFIAKFKMIHK